MTSLPRRSFGDTGITVTALGFGAGHIGSPDLPEKDVEKLLNEIIDAGVNLIDTARSYGLSEERIGKHLSKRRGEIVLSTKIGYGIPGYEDWTGPCISSGVDAALKLLRTDYIDIVHFHSCPVETLKRQDVLKALQDAVAAGKVRVPAYSGDNESLDCAINTGVFRSIQTSVNVADQRAIDTTIARAHARGMGVIAKRPAANAPWRYRERPAGVYGETYWLRLREMKIDTGGLSWPELALRFTAFLPGVDSSIIGTANSTHFVEDLRCIAKGPLPEEMVKQIRREFNRKDNNWQQET